MCRNQPSIGAVTVRCVAIILLFAAAVRVALGPSLSALGLATGVAALTLCFLLLFGTLYAPGKRRRGLVPPIDMVAAMLSKLLGLRVPLPKRHPSGKMSGQSHCYGESPDPRTDA